VTEGVRDEVTALIPNRLRGRPRDPGADRAILEAAAELLAGQGYRAMSIEAIAAEARVSKTTIYRRWRSKEELVIELLSQIAAEIMPVPDLGDTRSELVQLIAHTIERLTETPTGGMIQGLVSELPRNPTLRGLFAERLVGLRRAEVRKVLKRGIARGDLRADANVAIAHELLLGPVYYRLLLSSERLDSRFAGRIADAFLRGAAAPSQPP
jgi:AcrR family transcriptional regulator